MPNRNRMTVDCSVEGPGIKDTMHLGFVLSSDFNDFFWEMYNLCVWREVILNNWAFPLMIFNSCDEWPSSPQASPCTLQCAKDAAHWRDWWVSSNNISNILNIKKYFWKHFRVNILSKVHMMGLVLTLLYLIGGLGAVVWFVVSHKDEEEISVDERYLCFFYLHLYLLSTKMKMRSRWTRGGEIFACRNDWKVRKSWDLEKIFPVSRWRDCGRDRNEDATPPACPSKEDVQSLQPTAFFSFLNIECHIIDLNIQICSELHSRAN